MGVPNTAVNAAIRGPEKKKVKISELNSSKKHEFNVKPVSISSLPTGELIIFGQISHCLTARVDDQHWYCFKKKDNQITPADSIKMFTEKKEGGVLATVKMLKPVGVVIGAYFGVDVGKYIDKIDKFSDKASFIDFDSGYEKAIQNFLNSMSKSIKMPLKVSSKGLKLFEHDNFRGKSKLIGVNNNIEHFKNVGWNDKASSLQALVPKGSKLTVYKHDNFKGTKIEFGEGMHLIRDLKIHKLGDELTSCKWSRA